MSHFTLLHYCYCGRIVPESHELQKRVTVEKWAALLEWHNIFHILRKKCETNTIWETIHPTQEVLFFQ